MDVGFILGEALGNLHFIILRNVPSVSFLLEI